MALASIVVRTSLDKEEEVVAFGTFQTTPVLLLNEQDIHEADDPTAVDITTITAITRWVLQPAVNSWALGVEEGMEV
jgi:hypothetical protein